MQHDSYGRVWILDKENILSSGIDNSSNIYHNTYVSLRTFYLTRKIPDEPVDAYIKGIKPSQKNAELSGGNILAHTDLLISELKKVNISYPVSR